MLTFKYMCAYQCMNLIKIINTFSLALEKDFSSTIGCNDELTYKKCKPINLPILEASPYLCVVIVVGSVKMK